MTQLSPKKNSPKNSPMKGGKSTFSFLKKKLSPSKKSSPKRKSSSPSKKSSKASSPKKRKTSKKSKK